MKRTNWRAIDLFSGCGGLTTGLMRAGFEIISAVEIDSLAGATYACNHPQVKLIPRDIVQVPTDELCPEGRQIHLVAGCPPCQGFSRVRRRNRSKAAPDVRNNLIVEYRRIVEELQPSSIFLENVPGIEQDARFHAFLARLVELGYRVVWAPLELANYGVPQRRWRIVVLTGRPRFRCPFPAPPQKVANCS